MRLPSRAEPAKAAGLLKRLAQRFSRQHTRHCDQQAITFHYDVSNAFYALWLDAQWVYSCAYFEADQDMLDQAQRNKLDHICRKLRLQRGERLLDIGCGWGALVRWAARHHGVRAHGIALSQAQHDFAQQRIIDVGLQALVTAELRDYRDLQGVAIYDKVSTIGMFEHVGPANMPTYLAAVQRVLRPGGELDCVSNIQLGMERAGFEIQDVEALRRHYALTLRHWVQRLEANRDAALREVDEPTYRGVETALPLTRQDIYAPVPDLAGV